MDRSAWQVVIDRMALALAFCFAIGALPSLAPLQARDIATRAQALVFTDRHELPLGTLLSRDQEHTITVAPEHIAPAFLAAIVAAEDRRFYGHGAVDGIALVRAFTQLARSGHIVSGASTIAMQLARMIGHTAPTPLGKVSEMWLAARIEAGMSKREILAAYINRLPMGGNVYGVEAAARLYFGVPASDLDLAQAATLAALPNDPTRLDPYRNPRGLIARRRYVLARMVASSAITPLAATRAADQALALVPRSRGIIAAPHFLFFAAQGTDGGTIRTTIDRPLQQFAEAQVASVLQPLREHNVHHGAALVLDNASGDVLAYVGSPGYFSSDAQARNDGVQALRQPGSTLKPFLYELALETSAIEPASILLDLPASYSIPGGKLYTPVDYDGGYLGPVRVRIALANSLNVPAVRVLEHVGVGVFLDRLRALGFTHLDRAAEYYGLGLTLGSGEVSLWELAQAYLTIARSGDPLALRTRLDLPPHTDRSLGSADAWRLVTDIIADNHARAKAFGLGSVLELPFPAAVKTGTSSDFRDTWTVGFTREYTVAVWVGNFNGEAMHGVPGIAGAAPLWNRLMLHLYDRREPAGFDPPRAYALRPICATTGRKPGRACASVVQEYVASAHLAAYDAARSSPAGAPTRSRLRITFPHDGDRFSVVAGEDPSQALKLEASLLHGERARWYVNGSPLASIGDAALWRLRPGMWTLEATTRAGSDRVHITVEAGTAKGTRRGFSLVSLPNSPTIPASRRSDR